MNYETIPPATVSQLRARANSCFEYKHVPHGHQRLPILGLIAVSGTVEDVTTTDAERTIPISEPHYQPYYGRSPRYEAALAKRPELLGNTAMTHAGVKLSFDCAPLNRVRYDTFGKPSAKPGDTTTRTHIRHAGVVTPDDVAYMYTQSNRLMPLTGDFSKLHPDDLQTLPTYKEAGDPGRQNANLLMMWREADSLYRDHQDDFNLAIQPHSGVWEPQDAPYTLRST